MGKIPSMLPFFRFVIRITLLKLSFSTGILRTSYRRAYFNDFAHILEVAG